ncbi:hypothetical protein GCM10010873_22870 [Cypionkella aquatica]|uniref:Uncharacterized protein n=1 Tax=Cypionkella aquatica TaxID=1756042 RepID=A0AA37TTL2_9RHOB|nr:hypothetical protein [Cypionkella aquatica]GLS87313.1 hypothetical protein GCM10010873_22870 [Cypionkella aquatica]
MRKEDYSHLHTDLQAGLVITAYAITEINTFMRLFLNASHPYTGDEFLDSASFSQRNLLLRTMAAKVFEYRTMLEGKDSKNSDKSWSDEAAKISSEISESETMIGYRLAEDLRNEAANHYSFKAARKNLLFTSSNANFSLYVHQKTGNGFYPAGEEVMFIGRLSRHIDGMKDITLQRAFDEWMIWVREVITIMSNNYVRMITTHIFQKKPKKYARKVAHFVPFSMVQEPRKPSAPLFMRDDGSSPKTSNLQE